MDIIHSLSGENGLKNYDIDGVLKVEYLSKSKAFRVFLRSSSLLDPSVKDPIGGFLSKAFSFEGEVKVVDILRDPDAGIKDRILGMFLSDPLTMSFIKDSKVSEGEGRVSISHYSDIFMKSFKTKEQDKLMKRYMKEYYGKDVSIELRYTPETTPMKDESELLPDPSLIQGVKASSAPVFREPKEEKESRDNRSESGEVYGKRIKEPVTAISELDDNSGISVICGEVFKLEDKELRSGKILKMIYVTDGTSSLPAKLFLKKDETVEGLKEGSYMKLRGNVAVDLYSKELTMMVKDINRMEKAKREDRSKLKRIELHAHSSMSALDATVPVSRLMEAAKDFGHPAFAITDHGVVQAYPEAMDTAKKLGIKMIYGMEAYVVNDAMDIASGIVEEHGRFVVFDIETTGFSSQNDRIIEIGAVKLQDGEVVDRFSTFVDPEVPVPYKITELTGIRDSMVMGQPKIREVIPKFLEFIGDSILVAHNAYFDVGFIRKNAGDIGLGFNNPIVDTVPMARFLYRELKRHKLDVIAKHLGINMGSHHRAVDDAMTTVEILKRSFKKMEDMGISSLAELNLRNRKEADVTKLPMYHATILVRNQEGLKSLYQMVSSSHLDTFFKKPRIKKTMLQEKREGLLIGSACSNSELMRYILEGRTEEEIEEVADFYDYLEVQPEGNNTHLFKDGRIRDREQLRNLTKRIISLGEKLGKLVVATGDVHYVDRDEKIYREIIVASQSFRESDTDVDLHFRTTDEMLSEFSYLGREKAEELVVHNTHKVADMIGDVLPIPKGTFPPKIEGADEEIRTMTMDKAHELYGDELPEIVKSRVDKELNSIISNGYAVLYLIAHKLVAKSLSDGYLVGSRGSVGSSLVATFTGITEVNGLPPHYRCGSCRHSEFISDNSVSSGADLPEKDCPVCGLKLVRDGHDIPFETFLGFEGDKEPDIDLNFSGEYQGVVHKYTEELFGKGYVFKAGTIGTVADKTAYGYVKKYYEEKEVNLPGAEIERLAKGLTGVKRTTGQHPGGIMVVPRDNDIHNFTPIQRPADDNDSDVTTTHFDYHSISGRLLKLDILGHDDPTVLRMLQDLTGIDPKSLPLNDSKVLSLFLGTDALGVTPDELGVELGCLGLPEFGTKFVRGMLQDTKPRSFADLVRISGLSHGTDVWLNNAQYYIKNGDTTLSDCISTRDDIMVYLIYKGLPPKTAFNIMEKVRKGKGLSDEFEAVMREHEVPEWYIESCKKIKYMFPKGHAVAYVMMAMRIAWFKVYRPLAYYCAYFSVRADDFDAGLILKGEDTVRTRLEELYALGNAASNKEKNLITVLELAYELYKRGLRFKGIDLYKSDGTRFLIEDGEVRPPINALVGVGANAAASICEEAKKGEFISKEDLRTRCRVSRTVIETLEESGALEGLSDTNQISLFSL